MAERTLPDTSREALDIPKDDNESPDVKAVVAPGTATTKKKNPVLKVTETFLGGSIQETGAYVMNDVFIPAAKNMFMDMVTQGLERLFFGETRQDRARTRYGNPSYRSGYTSYSRSSERRPEITDRGRAQFDFDEIIIPSRDEADQVMMQLNDLLDEYGRVTVSDLYISAGIEPKYTDRSWGWRDLRGASIRPVREGYLINMPRPVPLNR